MNLFSCYTVEPLPTIPPKPTPLNTEPLHALLTPAASKWYELGLAMGFSEDTLEGEIYHGNSTDWLRLGEICGLYCQYKHSWEEVVHMLWEVEEWEIADKICRQERLEGEICMVVATRPCRLRVKMAWKTVCTHN